MTQDFNNGVPTSYILYLFLIFLLYSYYDTDMIKRLKFDLLVVLILLKIKFAHVQINMPKIGIPMLEAACINPCLFV